ncbi:MAG: DUF3574 domain-containing protein [Parvibaculum sp.]|nr:DUF3574 domain-containing protein [Parvibaculum sp.]
MRRGYFALLFIFINFVPAYADSAAVQTVLYFGLSRPDGGQVEEAQWKDFLARDVTPRFPDGLTVIDGLGQWRDARVQPITERTKLVIIVHPASEDAARSLREIKAIYVKRFNQISVLQTDQDVRVVE